MATGREHLYTVRLDWEGNRGSGTSGYATYGREHKFSAPGKAPIAGSSDPAFRGDPARWNPEELFVASLASCHQLWYLHLAAEAGVVVIAYRDEPVGTLVEDPARGGWFTRVVLKPIVTIRDGDDVALATSLHQRAHHMCFIANSVDFDVECEPTIRSA